MARKHLALVWLSAAACHSVVTESIPRAAVGDQGPVAVGDPIQLTTTWEGWCEYNSFDQLFSVHWGAGEGNSTFPCHAVDHTVAIKCDACDWRQIDAQTFEVVPTRPGRLQVYATLIPSGLRRRQTVALPPIEVKLPQAASARCNIWSDDTAQIDVSLAAGNSQLAHNANVAITGGEACSVNPLVRSLGDPGSGVYSCPFHTQTAALTVSTKDYSLQTAASCNVVLPTPEGLDRTATAATRFVLNGSYSYQHRDDFVRGTHERLARWGWQETAVTEDTAKTTIAATKDGSAVEIEIAESAGPEFTIYTWSYQVLSGHVIGILQVPGWFAMPSY